MTEKDFLRTAGFVGVGIFIVQLGLSGALGGLPLSLFLKDHLHLDPSMVAAFGAISGAPLYLKPLIGLLCDTVPLRGSRRRNYLLLAALLSGMGWLLLGLLPHTFWVLIATGLLINTGTVTGGTVMGAIIVEEGQRLRATGRFAALRVLVSGAAGGAASLLGGALATHDLLLTGAIGCGLFAFFFLVIFRYLQETESAAALREARLAALPQIQTVWKARTLWLVLGIFLLILIAPGFSTPLLYYQTDTLRFTPQQIALISVLGGLCGAPGPVLYALLARRIDARYLFLLAVACHTLTTLLYLGYRSEASAVAITGANSLTGAVAMTAAFDLATRATPRTAAALGFALIVSAVNLTGSLSDVLGSWLYTRYHLTFLNLVWVNAGTTALVVPLALVLPSSLTQNRESALREPVGASPEESEPSR